MLQKYDSAALGQWQMLNMLANSCTGKVSSSSSIGKITLFDKCTRHVCEHNITAIPVNLDIIKHMIITKWWTKGEPTNDNINNIWEWSSTDIKQNELMQNKFQLVYFKTSLTIQSTGNTGMHCFSKQASQTMKGQSYWGIWTDTGIYFFICDFWTLPCGFAPHN